jgi:hypothetical protein
MVQHVGNSLAYPPGFWRGKRVLELGAGTGLLSIVLALLGRGLDGPCETYLLCRRRGGFDGHSSCTGIAAAERR